MLALVIFNYAFINNVSDNLEEMISCLPDIGTHECIDEINKIEAYWDEKKDICRLSISFTEIDDISEGISKMKSYAQSLDKTQFECSASLLINSIEAFRRQEAIKYCNIF